MCQKICEQSCHWPPQRSRVQLYHLRPAGRPTSALGRHHHEADWFLILSTLPAYLFNNKSPEPKKRDSSNYRYRVMKLKPLPTLALAMKDYNLESYTGCGTLTATCLFLCLEILNIILSIWEFNQFLYMILVV